MKKYVKYNGRTESFRPCTASAMLVRNHVYTMHSQVVMIDQTNYFLEGVRGEFNSVWFDEVPVYFAYSKEEPEYGHAMHLIRLEKTESGVQPIAVLTSDAVSIEQIANDTYRVLTNNSVYIVQMI